MNMAAIISPGTMPGKPELADRLARDHRVEHQHHGGRHQDAQR
jgi:hypothetical protein